MMQRFVFGFVLAAAKNDGEDALHLLQTRAVESVSYSPDVDMCKIQSPEKILMDPVKNIDESYVMCKQAVGMQNFADRKFAATMCKRGKPCSMRNTLNRKKHYQICLCGVKHGSIPGGPSACNRQQRGYMSACKQPRLIRQLSLVGRSSYSPDGDMCNIQPPDKILMDPVKDIEKSYNLCKQAVGYQNFADRKFIAASCPRGKPCTLRNTINRKKHYQICLCGVKHGSIPGGPNACNRHLRAYASSCKQKMPRLNLEPNLMQHKKELKRQERSLYSPDGDMCKVQSPDKILMDPVKNVDESYNLCKQAVGYQNFADRKFAATFCQRGKPCALRNTLNRKKHYQICLCGVKHGSIRGGPNACSRQLRGYMSACKQPRLIRQLGLVGRSSYSPDGDMCNIQPPEKILMDPVKDIEKSYVMCKQAVGMQNFADRKFISARCPRGKPCSLRNTINRKKHYQICLCGVKHGSIPGGPNACNRQLRTYTSACKR